MPEIVHVFTDGGARGNPGPAGIGAVVKSEDGLILQEGQAYIGETTNNQAEYRAIILGLNLAKEQGAQKVHMFMDSELAVKQLNREYKVKNVDLAERFIEVWNLAQGFEQVTFSHVRRAKNKEADALVNKAIDAHV